MVDITSVGDFNNLPVKKQYVLLVASSVFTKLEGEICEPNQLDQLGNGFDHWEVMTNISEDAKKVLTSVARDEFKKLGYIKCPFENSKVE